MSTIVGYDYCDIILPVYNDLSYVKECLTSIIRYTPDELYHLYIIDDCSDTVTEQYLKSFATKYSNITLLRNSNNLSFLKSCNRGIEHSNAKYVLLINSGVVVVENWLQKLLACANSDPTIASVNPLTNHASQISIPIAAGMSFISMGRSISKRSKKLYPDVVTGVGFCMLLRRSALDDVGLFDEIYGHAYCEESDLCMHFTTRGYRTVIADDVYIFHKDSTSFIDRDECYLKSRKIFDGRWLDAYKKKFKELQKENPLAYLRGRFEAPQKRKPLTSMRETYRTMRSRYRSSNYFGVVKSAVRGLYELPFYTENYISTEYGKKLSNHKQLRVTYVINHLAIAGGVLSVVQLVNELILLGVDARIVALYQYPEIKKWKFYFEPMLFESEKELINNFPESDIVVATHWTTAPWVSEIFSKGKAKQSVYFLQDYESWFFPESDIKSRSRVIDTYPMIDHKVVKSSWLQNLLKGDGFETKKIWLGMDLGVFYPRDVNQSSKVVILAMARPRTPRRGFETLVDALSIVKGSGRDVQVILFGDDLSAISIPFDFIDRGVVSDQNELAELYSRADIFIDSSDFQGFGRTALEAMACRVACVVTNVGGVTEYAKDGDNCLLVPPKQPEKIAEAVNTLLNDNELALKLIEGAVDTVTSFSHKEEARNTLNYFNTISGLH